MSERASQAILFDLDGTVSDSAPGILKSLRHAFAVVGVPPLDPTSEQSLLGPPFYESLPPLVGADRTPAIIAEYRDVYGTTGMFDTRPYPGIPQLLADLHADGVRLAIATSKPEQYAEPIVEHLGLKSYLATVCGDTLDGARSTKALVIAEALRRLGHPDDVVMVGDRMHDVIGAHDNGLDCLGAGWGYALPGELTQAGAKAIYDSPAALAEALGYPRLDARPAPRSRAAH